MNPNMRYYNHEIDDSLPYVGVLNRDPISGKTYDEEDDAVDEKTLASFCEDDGKEKDDDG